MLAAKDAVNSFEVSDSRSAAEMTRELAPDPFLPRVPGDGSVATVDEKLHQQWNYHVVLIWIALN